KTGRAVFARQHAIGPRGVRHGAEIEAALIGAVRPCGWSAGIGHRSIRNWLSLEAGFAEQLEQNRARGAGYPFWRDSIETTGRRLTSDPIRNSLGLLPSGPDPVGEWLVHRQSPGPYLGPK